MCHCLGNMCELKKPCFQGPSKRFPIAEGVNERMTRDAQFGGLKPDADIWNRICGDDFINEDIQESLNLTKSAEGSRGTLGLDLVSENDTPKSLWSAENWSPQLDRSSICAGVNARSSRQEVKYINTLKDVPLKAEKERASVAKLRVENDKSKKKGRDTEKSVTSRREKSRESVLYSLTDKNRNPDRREEYVVQSLEENRSRSSGRHENPVLASRVDRNKSRKEDSYFPSRADRNKSNGRRDGRSLSSSVIKSSASGTPKESRLSSPTGKNKGERGREVSGRLSQVDKSRSNGRCEDSRRRYISHQRKYGSVERNMEYEPHLLVNGGRYKKLNAGHAGRNATKNLKSEKYESFNTPRRAAASMGKMSATNSSQSSHRRMVVKNTKSGSFEENYGTKIDRGHRSVSTSSRRAPSTESYGTHSNRSSRRERLSGNTSGSSILENKSEVGYELNSSYRGSDDPNHEVSENPRKNMTSSQFWRFSMRCLETHPRRGRKPKDCKTCEGHEHNNKKIMDDAERKDSDQWTRKFLNRLDGVSESYERRRSSWGVYNQKIKENLKHITTPRRTYGQNCYGWSRPYNEKGVEELQVKKEPMFHYLDKQKREKRKQGRPLSYGMVENPDGEVSKSELSSSRIGGNNPIIEILIPNPSETWKRQEEENRDLRFNSLDRVSKKPQMDDQSGLAHRELLKKQKLSNLEEKMRANYKMLGKKEARKAPTDHGILENQESLRKGLLANVEKDVSIISNVESLEDPTTDGVLSNLNAFKELYVPNMEHSSETIELSQKKIPDISDIEEQRAPKSDANMKSRPTSAFRKRVPTLRDAKRMIASTRANVAKISTTKRAVFQYNAHDPSAGEANIHNRSATSSRGLTPWTERSARPKRKPGDHHTSTKEEDDNQLTLPQEKEPTKIPMMRSVNKERHDARSVSISRNKTPSRRYCPSTVRSSIQAPSACQRFITKVEVSKKMLRDQEEPRLPKFSQDLLSSRSRERRQSISPCQRFVSREEKSTSFLQKKHEEDLKLRREARVSSSPEDRHVQLAMKRARDLTISPCHRFVNHEKTTVYLQKRHEQEYKPEQTRGSLSPRDQHLQSLQKQDEDLGSPLCDRFKKHEKENRIPSERLLPRTTAAKLRHACAPLKHEESLQSCDISRKHHEESRKIFEQSESSRESTPGDRGFWDWKEKEKTRESLREAQRWKEVEKPCNRWQTHDNRSRMVLEQARIRLEKELKQRRNDCPIPYERCQNCQDKGKEVDSLQQWREIHRRQYSN